MDDEAIDDLPLNDAHGVAPEAPNDYEDDDAETASSEQTHE